MTSEALFVLTSQEAGLALQRSPIITVGYLFQVLFSLAIVIALIYLIAKFVLPKFRLTAPGKLIQVVDRIMLEPQVSAYILRVGKSAWLIVASAKNVIRVDKIEEESLTI
jgi:flagellar biogenesis protein FliO